MAEAPKIVTALGYGGRVYRAGLEKELADAAKRGSFDLTPFISKEADDGLPLSGDWSVKASAAKSEAPPPPVYVEGVTFGSEAAGEAAKAAGLTADDFKGVTASGQEGYTKPDVVKVIASKEAK
jgi:hypothetical protein